MSGDVGHSSNEVVAYAWVQITAQQLWMQVGLEPIHRRLARLRGWPADNGQATRPVDQLDQQDLRPNLVLHIKRNVIGVFIYSG